MIVRRCLSAALLSAAFLASGITPTAAAEQTWGHVRGRFVWEGAIPKPQVIQIPAGGGVPARQIVNDSLIVNAKNRGVANVAFYMPSRIKGEPIPVHPSYDQDANQDVTISIVGGYYVSRATVLRTSQSLVLANRDNVAYNPNFHPVGTNGINPLLEPGAQASAKFSRAAPMPQLLSNNIQPWLQGFILLSAHPYATFSDENGDFELRNVPTGEWTFKVWHERPGYIESAKVGGQPEQWEQGRVTLRIEPGLRELGEIRIGGEAFATK